MRTVGAVVRGIRTPIIREGDDLVTVVRDSVLAAAREENIHFHDRDVLAVTESVVARAAGNYATVRIRRRYPGQIRRGSSGAGIPYHIPQPVCHVLRGIAMGVKKITLVLSYPADEVGNHLFDEELLENSGVNPYSDVLTEEQYRAAFGYVQHPFTGVDYVEYYKELIRACGCQVEIVFSNRPEAVLEPDEECALL